MRLSSLLLAAGFVLVALSQADADEKDKDKTKPVVVKLTKLSATAPGDWTSEKPANLFRKYQFKLPGAKDHPDAELTVTSGAKPGTEKNYPGWKATIVPPEGKTIDDVSKTPKWEVAGATVNVLDVSGTWKYKEKPQDKKETLLDDWRVIWVVLEEKDGEGGVDAYHFRLSGPKLTMDEQAPKFEKWLKSLK